MTQVTTVEEKKAAFLETLKQRHLLPIDQVHADSFKAFLDEFVASLEPEPFDDPIQESEAVDAN